MGTMAPLEPRRIQPRSGLVAVEGVVLAVALYTGLFPWLGMGVWDLALFFFAPVLAVLHVIGALVGALAKRRAFALTLFLAACGWGVIGLIGNTATQHAIGRLVEQAEGQVAERMSCEATRPDYYPAGALIHCLTIEGGDSTWSSYWVTTSPVRRNDWRMEENHRF